MKKMGVVLLIMAGSLIGFFQFIRLMPSEDRRALPASATDVHEYTHLHRDGAFSFLKAKMDAPTFAAYMKVRGMVSSRLEDHGAKRVEYSPVNWREFYGFTVPGWWDPKSDASGEFFFDPATETEVFRYAKYENGYLYLVYASF